ncbi:hypothetical protein B484DRAFT_79496 [Ochromonadaceae sp. CCMP2298]|nr:hypothetical protein B484DRAFT_79496 [Ochromonadaceae sp. CCMP2298]
MGSCCSKKATILSAFPQELGTPLLKELAPKLNRHARVVTIQLMSLHNIVTVPGSFVTATNAFVEFRLRPEDEMTGEQRQTSSIRPATVRPEWTPPESFQFVVLDMKKSRVLLSVYHHNPDLPMAPLPIGDCVLHTDGLKLSSTGRCRVELHKRRLCICLFICLFIPPWYQIWVFSPSIR